VNYTYLSASRAGLKREENEDALGVFKIENGLLVIVCDGLGGNRGGKTASHIAVETIYRSFENLKMSNYLERIKTTIQEAHSTILRQSLNEPHLRGMATTAEVLFFSDSTAYWGHVGDSRIYLLREDKLEQLTKDHTFVQQLLDEGMLTLKSAESYPDKNVLTRALGGICKLEVDLDILKFGSNGNCLFFVCTDGVTTTVPNNEIEKILCLKDQEEISRKLSSLVEKRGAPDDFSYVLITKED
jgi:serine/threonine protein phosphatase PrpC